MARPQNFEDILLRLPGARQSGDRWTAPCPLSGHKTPAGHVTLKNARDKVLITCQGGKNSYQDYCQARGFDSLNYSDNGIGGDTNMGQGRYSVTPSPKSGNLASRAGKGTVTPPALQSVTPVTVSTLAEAKHLQDGVRVPSGGPSDSIAQPKIKTFFEVSLVPVD